MTDSYEDLTGKIGFLGPAVEALSNHLDRTFSTFRGKLIKYDTNHRMTFTYGKWYVNLLSLWWLRHKTRATQNSKQIIQRFNAAMDDFAHLEWAKNLANHRYIWYWLNSITPQSQKLPYYDGIDGVVASLDPKKFHDCLKELLAHMLLIEEHIAKRELCDGPTDSDN